MMRGLKFIVFAVVLTLLVSSCKKKTDKTGQASINFQLEYNGAVIGLGSDFNNTAGQVFALTTAQFYLSDVNFITKDEENCVVQEVAFIQFNDSGAGSTTVDVPQGKYIALQFNLGVKKELNEEDPTTYNEPDHPLNVTNGTYWGWASFYRFATLEGTYDVEPDGSPDGSFAYHTGFDESYTQVEFPIDLNMKDFAIFWAMPGNGQRPALMAFRDFRSIRCMMTSQPRHLTVNIT